MAADLGSDGVKNAGVMLRSLRSGAAVALLYTALSVGLLAPLAATSVLPGVYDVPNHVGIIVQARAAIDEGQFPIRVAPHVHAGWRYPLFQFYGPLPYTFAGLFHKFAVRDNPYLAYKATLLFSMALGGTFIYKLAFWLVGARSAATLAGAMYIAAPYSLINLHARGAFTETAAQGLLPIVAYYTCRCYASPRRRFLALAAFSWCALALTHLITFAYSIIFLGTLVVFLSTRGSHPGRRLIRAGFSCAWSAILAAPFLIPVLATPYLRIHHPGHLVNPYTRNWLTPLSGLLSPVSVAPEPLPGHDYGTPHLHPAVGWPMLLAAGVVFCRAVEGKLPARRRRVDGFAVPLLVTHGLALFITWSPVDFWSSLPGFLHLAQFSYRFLAHVMWTGALLGALALTWLFGRLDGRHTLVGLLLIGLASGSYLPSQRTSRTTIAEVMQRPEIGPSAVAFLPQQDSFDHSERPALPILPVTEAQRGCRQLGPATSCLVSVPVRTLVELPMLFYSRLIDLSIDGRPSPYFPVRRGDYVLVAADMDAGTHEVRATFSGLASANWVGAFAWIVSLAALVPLRLQPWIRPGRGVPSEHLPREPSA